MKPERMARRWRRRHGKWLAALPQLVRRSRRRGGAEEIHEARVTLRRLRLSVRLGKAAFPAAAIARFRGWAAQVARATSPVRDLDIAIEWLRAAQAGPGLLQECLSRRHAVWHRRRARLLPFPSRLRVALARRSDGGGREVSVLAKRYARLETQCQEYVRNHLPRFFQLAEEDRHEFRRRVRRWRYLRELALPTGAFERDGRWRRLLAVQEALGEIQNLDLVAAAFRRFAPSTELAELQVLLVQQQRRQLEVSRKALAGLKPWLR
jgi:CHAD domain-containing protein